MLTTYGIVFLEAVGVVLIVIIAFVRPELGSVWFRKVENTVGYIARRRFLSVILVCLFALIGRLVVWPLLGTPEPIILDEFSYLLAADTFASGRLTNPPHPLWMHFESFHINQQPTYMSMFPPAQSLMLAVGQIIGGHPWIGVWISVGLMSASICWMLQAWVPPTWALLGGLLVVMRLSIFSYWMNSYWGGAVAALGGTLIFGALPRIVRTPRVCYAIIMGVGILILANSRPYEGLIFCLPATGALLIGFLLKRNKSLRVSLSHIIFPLLLFIVMTAGVVGYYNNRVTGNPFLMPHQLNRRTHGTVRHFLWQSPRPEPVYRHKEMRDSFRVEVAWFQYARSIRGLIEKIETMWIFYLGPVLTLPLVVFPWVLRDRRTRLLWITCGVMIVGLALEVVTFPHYAAPLISLIIALVLQSIRHLRVWRFRGKAAGLFLARSIPLLLFVILVIRVVAQPIHIPIGEVAFNPWQPGTETRVPHRAPILAQLKERSGRDLVIVRHKLDQKWHRWWVFNEADIDNSEVVWAREMDPASNELLMRYFKDRHVWLGEPDLSPPKLTPYYLSSALNFSVEPKSDSGKY